MMSVAIVAKRAAIRDPKDVPCDTVGNPADPDASYNAHKGQGYMAQIVETYCEDDSNEAVAATPDLITHVEVHKMTVHDGCESRMALIAAASFIEFRQRWR